MGAWGEKHPKVPGRQWLIARASPVGVKSVPTPDPTLLCALACQTCLNPAAPWRLQTFATGSPAIKRAI